MSCICASNLHHRPWVVTGWLLCDLRWNGTQFIKRVGQESYPQNYYMLIFVHSRASSTGNIQPSRGLPLSSSPYPFPISLTHMHMHTLLKRHPVPLFLRHSQRKNGRYILMEKRWPWLIILSLKNGSDTFSASMCLLVDGPIIVVRLWNQWNPFASLAAVWRGIQSLFMNRHTVSSVELHGWMLEEKCIQSGSQML